MNQNLNPLILPLFSLISIGLGVGIVLVGYMYPGDATSRQQVFQIGMALVTGGGGFMAGHAATKILGGDAPPADPTHPQPGQQPK